VAALSSREKRSALPDGTECLIRVPANWNGTLVRDLDFVTRAADAGFSLIYADMTRRGIAVAGTARHRLRIYQYDPIREIRNLDAVLDLFVAEFGRPDRVIQFGCSGGGHVALAVAEAFSERVDGAVALGAHTPVWLMNTFLDGWFALKALIGGEYERRGLGQLDDLAIAGLPNDGTVHASAHGRTGKLPEDWRKAIDAAQATPLGRARIALAFAIGQWPAWVNDKIAMPALDDPPALQEAMYHAVHQNAANPGGEARILFENAAQGQQLSWNAGIDYQALFDNGNPYLKAAVADLYGAAGASLAGEIERVATTPRIEKSDYALAFWGQPGRTILGRPAVPVVRLHMAGDHQVPPSLVEGYEDVIAANGKRDLVRTLFVKASGHCNYNAAESAAALQILIERLDRGRWPATDPESANRAAERLATGSAPRFFDFGPHRQARYNRVWLPG
jgi:pimeloyl-ACP methyl ester carboxylesterase